MPQWNATMANLTLMAFGSSAPEILLSVSEALQSLGKKADVLGAATIVGSAAFNLLVISAVSIVAVGDEPKKIFDMGVFAVTSIASVFAYVWLWLVLVQFSPNEVSRLEAWLTFSFFLILLVLAYGFDRLSARRQKKENDEEAKISFDIKCRRTHLRKVALARGDQIVIEVAQGISNENTRLIPEAERDQIIENYKIVLGKDSLKGINVNELYSTLKPESLFERFAAKKAAGIGASSTKDFVELKGQHMQQEEKAGAQVRDENENIGFKCLHYSVTESSGYVDITLIKKNPNAEFTFGVRTRDESAKQSKEYEAYDEIITMKKKEIEKVIQIKIFDNHDWQPDLDFKIQIYEPQDAR